MQSKFKTPAGRRRQYNKKAYAKRKALKAVASIPSGKSSVKVSPNVKAYVNKVINANAENKHFIKNVWTAAACLNGGFDSAVANTGLTTTDSIIPVLSQGVGVGQRIGNIVNVKSLTIRLQLQAVPVQLTNDAEGLPFYVRVVFYNRKDSMTNYTNSTILDLGGSSQAFTYQTDSLLLKYNRDLFNIIKSFTFKMAPCRAVPQTGSISERQPPNGFVSHILKSFKLRCPKQLRFDDTATQPMHRIFCAIGVVNADGSLVSPVSNPTNTSRLKVNMDSHLVYEDS